VGIQGPHGRVDGAGEGVCSSHDASCAVERDGDGISRSGRTIT
jgi:hypothetical protein